MLAAATLLAAACQSPRPPEPATPPPVRIVGWKPLASWTGRGNVQTETFLSDTGSFRIRWETKNESRPGAGTLEVAFRSGDSGRVIIDAVDQKGVGSGLSEVGDMVRWYYLSIDSANVDWSVTVEEPIMGRTVVRTDP
ncbi:MAG: hypothetical protein A3H97_24545 [Acidobacteria bacterium RIFCSPLOWO2_02_FULL_65_29]|nr:MAG: hypothetical protein A3H97_24545 [Acidobacteria bacterium RIFCSPLOWO2_02_FULL_65_29]